jgi:hypothetical protein
MKARSVSGIYAFMLLAASPAFAQRPEVDVAAARASLIGIWAGKLEYRDYSADRWFGLPVTLTVRDAGDGVTHLRTSDFDDGPKVGIVRISSMTLLGKDGVTEYATSFRKGRTPELDTVTLALSTATDTTHWTLVATRTGRDDNRPALIRETTVRDGDALTTLKEVDFTDDSKAEWLTRNRTTLTRKAAP